MTWRSYTDFLKRSPVVLRVADRLGRGKGRLRWLDSLSAVPPALQIPNLSQWINQNLAAAWIGHATVLLRIGGMTILTDPVFSQRVGIGMGLFTLGPLRHQAPALKIEQLPPLDLILISHAHFDHLDRPTLVKLPKSTPIVTASRTSDLLNDLGFRSITELRWGETVSFNGLTIRATEVNHWGARTFYDQYGGYNGYFLESGGRRVLYAGDTAYQQKFRDQGKVDLAIFGIGAYDPYVRAHATPEQAWEMAGHLHADHVFPMHHSTFKLSHEPMTEPMERMLAVAGNDVERIVIRGIGGTWNS